MEREEALALLGSSEAHERLRGARALADLATSEDRDVLVRALRSEPDVWTRSALRRALRTTVPPAPLIAESSRVSESELAYADFYAKAVEETSARVVHELNRLVGRVKVAARAEWPAWEGSRTRDELARLEALMAAIERLGRAAAVPAIEEFDLAGLVASSVRSEIEEGARIEMIGREPLLVVGDPYLVDLVLQNGLRNAVEAVQQAGSDEPVIVSWGDTDRDCWFTVADRGSGLPVRRDLFQLGVTTKDRAVHSGVGLAIARQAVQSLAGSLSLSGRDEGGVLYEVRWPR